MDDFESFPTTDHMPFTKKRVLLLVETSRVAGRNIIEGISRFVIERQNWLIHLSERHIIDFPDWLKSWRGDGIITRTADLNIHRLLKRKRIPHIELHGDNEKYPLDVFVDETQVAEMAADHLWSQGYRNFAFFALGNAWWIEKRRSEFTQAVSRFKAECRNFESKDSFEVFPTLITDEKVMKRIIRWIKKLPKPVGIWAATDLNAFNVLEACLLSEIAVPGEVAVLGTDNDTLLCKALIPQLSSVDINAREIGYQAALLLEKRMNGEKPETPIKTSPSHVEVRQSTDIIAIPDRNIALAVAYIRENSHLPGMCVANVAGQIGLSVRTLQLKFKKVLKSSPEDEIIKTRLKHAERLLRDSDVKISAIPFLIGLTSKPYFYRLFFETHGVTPQDYRQAHQEMNSYDAQ